MKRILLASVLALTTNGAHLRELEQRVHRNATEVSHSDDLYKKDPSDRNTEKMGELAKNHEDNYH